ncbi:DUF11 domain-containing protein, partial [Deltaproteobacteria bacterium PRO3]|nr:DUF11 domain-containing protein [Deltaproteobacteria bacterium PRO3]
MVGVGFGRYAAVVVRPTVSRASLWTGQSSAIQRLRLDMGIRVFIVTSFLSSKKRVRSMSRLISPLRSVRTIRQTIAGSLVALAALLATTLSPGAAHAAVNPAVFPTSLGINTPVGTTTTRLIEIVATSSLSLPLNTNISNISVSFTGAGAAQFGVVSNTCSGQTLTDLLDCEILISYTANDTTPDIANLVVNFNRNVGSSPTSLTFTNYVTGTGTTGPNLEASPTFISFNNLVGSSSTQIVQVVNTGISPLPLNPISFSGTDFTVSNNTCSTIYSNLLPAGEDCHLTIEFFAFSPGSFSDGLSITSPDTSVVPVNISVFGSASPLAADLSILKSMDPAQVTVPPGGPVTINFTVENSALSTDEAGGVFVRDTIAGPFTVDLGTLPAFCTVNPTSDPLVQQVLCNVWDSGSGGFGTMLPGDTFSFQIQGFVDDVGQVDDLAIVQDGFGNDNQITADPDLLNNSAVASVVGVSTSPVPQANLRVVKEADNLTPAIGSTLTYQIRVRNEDPSVTAANLTLRDITVGNILNLGVSASGGWTCTTTGAATNPPNPPNNPRRIECTRASLAPLTTSTITLTGTVNGPQPITNTATVSSTGTLDPDISDNTQSIAVIPVDPNAPSGDLAITKTITGPATLSPGVPVNYQIVVTNNGGATVNNIRVIDRIIGNFTGGAAVIGTFVGCDGPVTNNADTYFCNVNSLAPAGTRIISYSVTPNAAGVLTNVANVAGPINDTNPNNDEITVNAPVGVPATDLSITKTVTPAVGEVGDPVSYTITVTNNGPNAATNIQVTDIVSGPLSGLATSTPGCAVAGSQVNCNFAGPLGAGLTIPIAVTGSIGAAGQIDNIASVSSSSIADTNPSNNSAVASTIGQNPALPQTDLSITNDASPVTGQVGDPVTFTITVNNTGAAATNVQVTGILSGPLTAFATSTPGCSVTGSQLNCLLAGPIASGGSSVITATGNINGNGQIDLTASVSSQDVTDTNLSNNTAVSSTIGTNPALPNADLSIVKSVTPAVGNVGDPVTYTIVVTNNGPDAATNIQVTDLVSGPLTGLATSTAGCAAAAGQVTCNFAGPLGAGLTIPIAVTGTIGAPGQIDNIASVSSASVNDTNLSNNSAVASLIGQNPALPQADIRVNKEVNDLTPEVGDTVTYTIHVRNLSPTVTATNLNLTDITIGDITLSGGSGGGWACSNAGGNPPLPPANPRVISCTLASLAPSTTSNLTVTGTVNSAGPVTNTASASSTGTTDPNPSNNTQAVTLVATDPALADADLSITKTVTPAFGEVGDPVTYTITVTNNGPDAATNIQVTDIVSGPLTGLATSTAGCSVVGNQVNCAFAGPLGSGLTIPIAVTGTINAAGQIDNIASVSSQDVNDTNLSNNSAVASLIGQDPALPDADLTLSNDASIAQGQVGDPVTFTIEVTNNGPNPASNVQVTGILAGPLTAFATSTAGCSVSGTVLSCLLPGPIASAGTATITATGTLNGGGQIDLTASVSSQDTHDTNLSNNTAVSSVNGVQSVCGDGLVEAGEQCDDGNTTPGDGCSATCQYESVCGDGLQEGLEQCDDGNTTPGDGCDDICRLETVCGDGLQEGLEQCDDGNTVPGDGCDDICRLETVCGDNLQQGLEECDDGNTAGGDGCDQFCRREGADLSVVKAVDRAVAAIGDTVTFTLTVTNSGPRDATNVVVTDQLVTGPNTFTITAITPSTGSCTPATPAVAGSVVISCNLGSMDASDVETITVVGTVDSLGQIDNTASVADTNDPQGGGQAQVDPNPSNNVSVASVNGTAANVNLSITKTSSLAQANQDQDVTFTITVNNPGTANAQGVVITDTIDGPFTINTISFAAGTCAPATPVTSPATIVCTPTAGVLPPGATTITMTGRVSGEGQVDNTVSVDSTITGDNDRSNNTAVASVIGIARNTDLSVTKTVDFPQATVGDTVTFTVVVTNLDTVNNAEGVRITDIATGPMEVQSM